MKTYLVELLMKQDQMSMAASIESRVPFLDHKLVEFAATLPDGSKLSRLHDQADPARGGAMDLLPLEILTRPKMGFPVPFGALDARAWQRRGARRPARSADAASAASSIPRRSSALLADHALGRGGRRAMRSGAC